jgi:hypothetical protein
MQQGMPHWMATVSLSSPELMKWAKTINGASFGNESHQRRISAK